MKPKLWGSHPPWDFLYGWGEPPKFQGGWDYTQNWSNQPAGFNQPWGFEQQTWRFNQQNIVIFTNKYGDLTKHGECTNQPVDFSKLKK